MQTKKEKKENALKRRQKQLEHYKKRLAFWQWRQDLEQSLEIVKRYQDKIIKAEKDVKNLIKKLYY